MRNTSNFCPKLFVQGLELSYPEADQALISGLSFELEPGQCLGISGANASGKSSLIHALCGIIPHYIKAERRGEILFQDAALHELPLCEIYRYMAVVLADADAQLMFPTIESELAFALENMALPSDLIRQRISSALDYFGLDYPTHKAPHLLSGGEQRLLLLSVVEAMDCPIVLLDEPERGLSKTSLKLLLNWLDKLRSQGRIVILASHHPDILCVCDQRIALGS